MSRSTIVSIVLAILIGSVSCSAKGNNYLPIEGDTTIAVPDTIQLRFTGDDKIEIIHDASDETAKKRFVSALFAFPFPFGFMGAHRVMLGTKPWVPVVYVATFGGCFGLLPMIDFFVITFSKDISAYENNPQIFMWMK